MQKPVLIQEKLLFTLQVQASKGTDEILCDLIEQKYNGYVDIWPEISVKNSKVEMQIVSKKVAHKLSPLSNNNATRFEVLENKGARVVK